MNWKGNVQIATTVRFKLWKKDPPTIHATVANGKTLRANDLNASKKRWREKEDIPSFFKVQKSFGIKIAPDFKKNSELF